MAQKRRMAASEHSVGQRIDEQDPIWRRYAISAILIAGALYWMLMALRLAPLHFDESQYWSYGEAFDFGYYSKPPLVAWLIRLSTELFGDTEIGVRALAPALHAWIAWMIYLSAERLFEPRTAFWACVAYLAMPGVVVSSSLMTTDPVMMAAWSSALYALIRAIEPPTPALARTARWWLLCGAAVGLGLLAKYTAIAFVGGALGYAVFSRPATAARAPGDWRGPALAVVAALLAFSPNLIWNAQNGFASFLHVADNAKLGGGPRYDVVKALEFFAVQAVVAGPVVFGGLLAMAVLPSWRHEWSYRLLMWLAAPLPLAMIVQAFLSRAHPNWAAPAYIAAAIAVCAWLLDRNRARLLYAAAVIGAVSVIAFNGLAGVYALRHAELPRLYDPYKKMRPNPPICRAALERLGERLLVGADRRLLADCMFAGGLGLDRIRIWAPGAPGNHYQLAAPLEAGEPVEMVFLALGDRAAAADALSRFERVSGVREGEIRTHADRSQRYVTAVVSGFRGY